MGNKQQKRAYFLKAQEQKDIQNHGITEAQKQQQQRQKARQLELNGQKHASILNTHLIKVEDIIKKKQYETEVQEARIKELIAQGRKTDAKRQVGHLKQLNDELAAMHTRKVVLLKQKNQLEVASVDANMAGAMNKANDFLKSTDDISQKITDILFDQREIQTTQAEVNDLFNQMGNNGNPHELDDLFCELESEVNQQKARTISEALPQRPPLRQVTYQEYQPSFLQPIFNKKQRPTSQRDDIEHILND